MGSFTLRNLLRVGRRVLDFQSQLCVFSCG